MATPPSSASSLPGANSPPPENTLLRQVAAIYSSAFLARFNRVPVESELEWMSDLVGGTSSLLALPSEKRFTQLIWLSPQCLLLNGLSPNAARRVIDVLNKAFWKLPGSIGAVLTIGLCDICWRTRRLQ